MRKGMSQTLALIVAASVLMMTALTVIFMTQGSLQDTFSGTNNAKCNSALEFRLQNTGQDGTFNVPSSCFNDQGQPLSGTMAEGTGCTSGNSLATKQSNGQFQC